MTQTERLRTEYRHDIRVLCDKYVADVSAYLDNNVGKRFKCTTYEHSANGKILCGSEGFAKFSGSRVESQGFQPIYFDVWWRLDFTDGSSAVYNEDMFGIVTFE